MASVRGGGAFARFARDHVGLVPFLLFILFPIYFMVLTAFKTNRELYDLEAIPFWIGTGCPSSTSSTSSSGPTSGAGF